MALVEKINDDIKAAMKAQNKELLETLRSIKSALLLLKTEKGNEGVITEESEIKLLQKLTKQRKESAAIYKSQGRTDLEQKELFEESVIEKYLPQQMNEQDLENAVKSIIKEVGASSIKDMGKVMGIATKNLAGKADGKKISELVKQLLT